MAERKRKIDLDPLIKLSKEIDEAIQKATKTEESTPAKPKPRT